MPLKTPGNFRVDKNNKQSKQGMEKTTIHFEEIPYLNFWSYSVAVKKINNPVTESVPKSANLKV